MVLYDLETALGAWAGQCLLTLWDSLDPLLCKAAGFGLSREETGTGEDMVALVVAWVFLVLFCLFSSVQMFVGTARSLSAGGEMWVSTKGLVAAGSGKPLLNLLAFE